MKFIEELKIDFFHFIQKDFFIKEIEIKKLTISELMIEYNASDYSSYYVNSYSKKLINNKNENKIKFFIDNNDISFFSKVNNFSIYYDYVVDSYVDYLKEEKGINISLIKDYIYKSSKHCYEYLKNNDVSESEKKKLESVIFRNIEYTCRYAVEVVKDRIPQYEELILNDLKSFKHVFYLKRVLIELINYSSILDENREKFDEFYEKSQIFREQLDYYIRFGNLRIFDFNFWNETYENLILEKNPELLNNYFEDYYLGYYYKNRKDFNEERLKNLMEKINSNPILICEFYKKRKKGFLLKPENEHIKKILMSDSTQLINFLINVYRNSTLEKIEEDFPGYQEIIKKEKTLKIILDFFESVIRNIIFNYQYFDLTSIDKETKEKFKKYLYDNYIDVINKISKDAELSYLFAMLIMSPFKEGEKLLLNTDNEFKISYLFLIKDLGPKNVLNYDLYDFSILDNQEEDDDL